MQGFVVPGRWVIAAWDSCGGGQGICFVVPPNSAAAPAQDLFETLSVVNLGTTMQLQGSFTAPADGAIYRVDTMLFGCGTVATRDTANTPAPAQCLPMLSLLPGPATGLGALGSSSANTRVLVFTGTTLSAIPVVAGQNVQVRVTISFS
ncbi:MAG: hypothetical protein AB7H96_16920 [Vicinamibacterales bacterium]